MLSSRNDICIDCILTLKDSCLVFIGECCANEQFCFRLTAFLFFVLFIIRLTDEHNITLNSESMSETNSSCNSTETWSRFAKFYDPIRIGSIDGTDVEPHDKAIVRAMKSEYVPNKFVKGRPECTIFVSRLNPKTTKDTIKDTFSKFGKLKRFRLVRDIVTGLPKGYAFIEYESECAAEEAYRKAYKMNIDGHIVFVDFECERLLKGWKPRRLGGGFGGRKESGQLRYGGRDRPFRKPVSLEVKEREERERLEQMKSKKRSRDYYEDEHRRRHEGLDAEEEFRRKRRYSRSRSKEHSESRAREDKYDSRSRYK